MRNVALSLAVNEVKSGLGVPVTTPMECLLQHFHLDMAVNFSLKVISHGLLDRGKQLLSIDYVNFICCSLTCIWS